MCWIPRPCFGIVRGSFHPLLAFSYFQLVLASWSQRTQVSSPLNPHVQILFVLRNTCHFSLSLTLSLYYSTKSFVAFVPYGFSGSIHYFLSWIISGTVCGLLRRKETMSIYSTSKTKAKVDWLLAQWTYGLIRVTVWSSKDSKVEKHKPVSYRNGIPEACLLPL